MAEGSGILRWASNDGSFKRQASQFRSQISREGPFLPEKGRYILYVSYACPALKGLTDVIGVAVVHYLLGSEGWSFDKSDEAYPGCTRDPVYDSSYLRELYLKADPKYSGRFTVPVLWDKKSETIVSNESADIIRMFNASLNDLCANPKLDLVPEALLARIEEANQWTYDSLNNGVYKAGFATAQEIYESNARAVASSLEKVDQILAGSKFVNGDVMTETDIRLFTTLIRFDPVYVGHFKCSLRAVKDCPNILRWLQMLYDLPEFHKTVFMDHIKKHYYMSHKQINPNGIVPLYDGPIHLKSMR